ncbi:hypothetical protein MP228_000207 [Amoeboaphelidium protococcarum]|nr:hypothetical protein MP228_000207 [Amoeboaphelidium protococcarum]
MTRLLISKINSQAVKQSNINILCFNRFKTIKSGRDDKSKKNVISSSTSESLQDVVFPRYGVNDNPNSNDQSIISTSALKQSLLNEQAEKVFKEYQRVIYEQKSQQIQKQHEMMKAACLELERCAPELFKRAMIKEKGQYMPLQRRILTDTPADKVWDYDYVKDKNLNNDTRR